MTLAPTFFLIFVAGPLLFAALARVLPWSGLYTAKMMSE